ncbi:hypothetical protein Snas_0926 [Stackebrandtia nassauensis DSM 44728]|uniref:DUF3137 domain-containing protein n=1 Tax=Stackebrandtia nassauensis (strain DSM 44728 / CIP 108903 / NRRL B-16338 / NBRC 102104 / LLR-40K-21) TaxID=446470 RepID=D3Q928_STANL|nr:hypothetical protein Snas_0926 [Stackebrandtia nassauensis DSM 44728]
MLGAMFLIIAIVALILMAVFSHQKAKQRETERRQWAAANGFHYVPGFVNLPDASIRSPFRSSGRNSNFFEGGFHGHRARAFVHTYTTTRRDNEGRRQEQVHRYAVAAVAHAAGPNLHLDIAPQGIFGRLADKLGFGVLTGDVEFDRAFKVRSGDEFQARSVLRPEATAWISQDPRFRNSAVRFEYGWVMVWYPGHLNVGHLSLQFAFLADIASRLRA